MSLVRIPGGLHVNDTEQVKISTFVIALLTLGCGGKLDLSQVEASREFDLCVTYCTLNRAGSEITECYQPVEECPDVCQGVTGFCSSELNHLVECQLNAGASLVCQELNGELNPWVEFIDDVCEEEGALRDKCVCDVLGITCPE